MKKRIFATIAVLGVLSAALAACGGKADGDASSVTQNPSSAEKTESAATNPPSSPTPEPYSFTMFMPYSDIVNSPDGWTGFNDLPVYKELEKRTGVTVNYIGGDYQTIQTLLAGNDYPEVMVLSDTGYNLAYPGGTAKGVADGVIKDLSGLLEQYAPNYLARVAQSTSNPAALKLDDGRTAGIYALSKEAAPPVWGYVMREDLLRQVKNADGSTLFINADGSTKTPETYADWTLFLQYVRDNALTSGAPLFIHTGACDSYGYQLQAGFGATYNYYVKDRTVKYGLLEREYWDYLDLMADWWLNGFVDQSFASGDANKSPTPYDVAPALVTGTPDTKAQYAVFYSYASKITEIETLGKMSPDGEAFSLIAVSPPVKNAGDKVHFLDASDTFGGYFAVITDKCKNPERVLEWFNYIYSDEGTELFNFGVEGVSYTLDGGKERFTDVIMNTPGYEPSVMKELYTAGNAFTYYSVPTEFAYTSVDQNRLDAQAKWVANADGAYVYPTAADAFISSADKEKLTAEGNSALMTIYMLYVNHIMHGYASADLPYPANEQIMRAAVPQIEGWVAIRQAAYDAYLSAGE